VLTEEGLVDDFAGAAFLRRAVRVVAAA